MPVWVAPFAGAWIEIFLQPPLLGNNAVAPFAGAWIEIRMAAVASGATLRRSLRGSVD